MTNFNFFVTVTFYIDTLASAQMRAITFVCGSQTQHRIIVNCLISKLSQLFVNFLFTCYNIIELIVHQNYKIYIWVLTDFKLSSVKVSICCDPI